MANFYLLEVAKTKRNEKEFRQRSKDKRTINNEAIML